MAHGRSSMAIRQMMVVSSTGRGKAAWLSVLLLALILLPPFFPSYWVYLSTEIIINCLFALSLNILFGYTGMISFGHSAYFALGAYTAALLVKKAHWPMIESLVAAPFVVAAGALMAGLFCIRRSGVYFIMLTLAIAQVFYTVIYQSYDLTGGDNGLIGVLPAAAVASPLAYYYFSLLIILLAGYGIYRVVHSPFGYALRAIRDNPRRAESVGIDVQRCRLIAFILAAFFAGIAGALYAFFNAAVFPTCGFWIKSAEPLMAVILGGPYHFAGPILGATMVTLLRSLLTRYIQYWMLILGSIMVILVLFFRGGLTGAFKQEEG